MFRKEKENKEFTREEIRAINAVCDLVRAKKIPFSEWEPLINKYSETIEAYIKEGEEEARQRDIDIIKGEMKRCKEDIDCDKQKIDIGNNHLSEFRAELEDLKGKRGYERDEQRIKNLLWWTFNNEEQIKEFEDCIREKEDYLKRMEEKLLKLETTK